MSVSVNIGDSFLVFGKKRAVKQVGIMDAESWEMGVLLEGEDGITVFILESELTSMDITPTGPVNKYPRFTK